MDFKITKDEKKPLLKRREICARLGYDARTPSRSDVRKELAKKLNAKEELLLIKKIFPHSGTQAADIEADIYDDEATMKAVELGHVIKKHFPEKKAEEKPAEEAAAPAEPPKA
ncbi:30S ribosomal protein S24e [Candidatus Woesearchaeota archaeon]|nr:30S ribosomal protein S24e [Candidatus Woesearchaeota archaeon]